MENGTGIERVLLEVKAKAVLVKTSYTLLLEIQK